MRIRAEDPSDPTAIRDVIIAAFGQSVEADIVEALRSAGDGFISLVAEDGGSVVGHILFTSATVDRGHDVIEGMGLAPLAVHPSRSGEGIGSALVEAGIDIMRERGVPFVVVLGHPEFYPRFGFDRASAWGLRSQWEGVPDEAFMVLVLDPVAMQGVSGVARYRDEFDAAV